MQATEIVFRLLGDVVNALYFMIVLYLALTYILSLHPFSQQSSAHGNYSSFLSEVPPDQQSLSSESGMLLNMYM